jgi:hypothetical protein
LPSVADRLAAGVCRIRVEGRGEEDGAAAGVEVEDLRRVRREPEAVLLGPRPDLVGATLEDRDVQGVDLDRHQDLGARSRASGGEELDGVTRDRVRLLDEALERPVATLLDARRDAGQGSQRAEGSAAALELEGRDVVLDAVVVADERRRPEEVHRPVRADEATAGEGRCGREQDGKGAAQESQSKSPVHRATSGKAGRVRPA